MFFHGGGGGFLSNGAIDTSGAPSADNWPISWNHGLVDGNWYKVIFTVEAKGNNKFDPNIKIYNASAGSSTFGEVGELATEHSMTDDMTNPTRVGPAVTNVAAYFFLDAGFASNGNR